MTGRHARVVAVIDLRARLMSGGLTAGEREALGDLLVAVDAAVHVHSTGPGPLWAQVAELFHGLTSESAKGEMSP